MNISRCTFLSGCLATVLSTLGFQAHAQQIIDLTLDSAIGIAMQSSYRINQLEMGIEESRYWLSGQRAALKSKVYMNLYTPDLNSTSEFKWNSALQKDEIIRENTRKWQMDLSIRQPVVLFGYPTNGYLSFNNRVYQYRQKTDDGNEDVKYYNRHFVSFEQPFFKPNELKNDIESAELDLENTELRYTEDQVRLFDDIAGDYYDIFERHYRNRIYQAQVNNLDRIYQVASEIAAQDTSRLIEAIQIKIELSNAQESLLRNQSDMQLDIAQLKQRLRLSDSDSLHLPPPDISITPITVDIEDAVQKGFTLRPRLRQLDISRRRNEIQLENQEGQDKFYVNLEMTYGLEKQEEYVDEIWEEYDNSYSASVRAYIPIWDWGRRKSYIEARRIRLKQTELSIEETQNSIRSEIMNAVANLEQYQQRALNIQENVSVVQQLTDISTQNYIDGIITYNNLLQVVERQRDTEMNFLNTYLGYRLSLLRLMRYTYYDYEQNVPLQTKFGTRSS